MEQKFHVEQFGISLLICDVELLVIAPHDKLCNVCCLVVIYAVLTQNQFRRDFRTFVWSKNSTKNLVCGDKMTNIMYGSVVLKVYQFSVKLSKIAKNV